MSEQITITRALTELKLLDKRITKKITSSRFVDIFQNRKDLAIGSAVTKDVFVKDATGSLKSIEDLIDRRNKIKSAILISNATVKVKIGGAEYAVIEVIERKNSIEYEKTLLDSMKAQASGVKSQVEKQKPQLEKSIEEMVKQNLGADTKPTEEDYDSIAKPLLKANELNILDPCKIEEKISALDEKIDEFLAEVDFVLTESNSVTKIDI